MDKWEKKSKFLFIIFETTIRKKKNIIIGKYKINSDDVTIIKIIKNEEIVNELSSLKTIYLILIKVKC